MQVVPKNQPLISSQNRVKNINNRTKEPILNEIQKKIQGKREEKFTPTEIDLLFNSPVTNELNLIIYKGLKGGVLNPDVTILQIIPRAISVDYLIPIALCLRFGADANMYVKAPNLGTIHILGYLYSVLGDTDNHSDVLSTIVLMLIVSGARSSMPIFDNNAGKIRNNGTTTSISVVDWLDQQGYYTILDRVFTADVVRLQQEIDKESLVALSIMLDLPRLMPRDYVKEDMLLAIKSFSNIDNIPTDNYKLIMDYKSLVEAVTYFNSNAFEKLLNRGQLPSYLLINKILIEMRTHKTSGLIIVFKELEQMLSMAISLGVQLDKEQLNILSTLGRDVYDFIIKEYEQPYWKKICKISNSQVSPPEPLVRLALSLNIDPSSSLGSICNIINNLAKADKEVLKTAAKKRQQLRLSSQLGYVNEFINDKIPTLICRNKSLLTKDPFEYNDIHIAYYRDEQGAVWCFTSDNFADLIETGTNPYNGTLLPISFQEELKYRLSNLKRIGIDQESTFNESIDNLNSKDVVSNYYSDKYVNLFIEKANFHRVSTETVRSLTKEQMNDAFKAIGYNLNLTSLSTNHALITTAIVINYIEPDLVNNFFDVIVYN